MSHEQLINETTLQYALLSWNVKNHPDKARWYATDTKNAL